MLAALLAMPAAAAGELALEALLHGHRLRETAASGTTLVTERATAPGLRLHLGARPPQGLGWQASLGGWAARARYDGRTQSGLPVRSTTQTHAVDAAAAMLWAASPALVGDAGLRWESFRRRIEGEAGSAGLDERLSLPLLQLGLRWNAGPLTLRAAVQHGGPAPLDVRFDGGVYDRAGLRSGRARGLELGLEHMFGAGWRVTAGWQRLDVAAGAPAPLYSDGRLVGTVAQPAWRREGLQFTLLRRFE